jgi:tetratricopeptide (TPR) repeat protein
MMMFSVFAVISLAWLGWQPQLWVSEPLRNFPAGAAAFVNRHALKARAFHHQNEGGFYGWALKQRVFWDGRNLLFSPLVREYLRYKDFSEAVSRYQIEMLLINRALYEQMRPWLERHKERWFLVYWDDQAAIYLAKDASFSSVWEKRRYQLLRPFGQVLPSLRRWSKDPKREALVYAELTRAVESNPQAQLPLYMRGLFSLYKKELSKSLSDLQRAAALRPKAQVYLSLAYVYQRLQRSKEAQYWLFQARRHQVNHLLEGGVLR